MKAIVSISVLIAVAILGWFLGARFGSPLPKATDQQQPANEEANASTPTLETIRAQGRLKPASGVIKIVATPGERVSWLTTKTSGDRVKADEVLVTLSSRSLRKKDLELAQARRADALKNFDYEKQQATYQLKSAELAVAEANAADQKIAQQATGIKGLQRQHAVAGRLLQRLQRLREKGATASLVNQTDLEKQELLVEQLQLQIEQAESSLKIAKLSAARAKQSAENNLETVKFSIANAADATPLKTLDAAVELAEKALETTQIRAPADATIIDIVVQQGDSVTNQPILLLADLTQMNCEAEVVDAYLKLIDVDASPPLRAKISANALPAPLFGTVVAKGLMVGEIDLKSPNPFAKVDQRTGIVTIELDDPDIAAKYVNLQVSVEIETEPSTF